MSAVLDASALLAWLQGEPGAESVDGVLAAAVISSVNWSEVLQKSLKNKIDVTGLRADLESVGLTISPFAADDAELAARLWLRGSDFSLADRACLALGIRLGLPVWTADRAWAAHDSGAEVNIIRP